MPALCKLLGVGSHETVRGYATHGVLDKERRFDPLRLRSHPTSPRRPLQRRDRVLAWKTRTFGSEEEKAALAIVVGWEAIGNAVDCSAKHASMLAARRIDPLPVFPAKKHGDVGYPEVWAYADALRDWLETHAVPYFLVGGPTVAEDVIPPQAQRVARWRGGAYGGAFYGVMFQDVEVVRKEQQ
jgi:hypothetical protein